MASPILKLVHMFVLLLGVLLLLFKPNIYSTLMPMCIRQLVHTTALFKAVLEAKVERALSARMR